MHTTAIATATADTFGAGLRSWRAARGISQLELSNRAGTTQRHLSYLEQGRSTPSRTMVVRLAESLELSLRERNELLLSAGYAPLFPESNFDGAELQPVREALLEILAGHEPYPAVVARATGEIILANRALEVFTEGADPELLVPPINGFRLALHPGGMAPRIKNFPEWARHVIEALRAALRRSPSVEKAALLAELERYVPPYTPASEHLGFAVPLRMASPDGDLTLMTTLMTFATAVDVTLTELHLETFLPADAATARILHARAEARGARG